ncbi:Glutamyl-tRNA(Gln) amidotransferase subunit A [bioreactor metagenome]|uniref:Glutamyl-tRNA(Gln) amidotransferase subunit A n=1 Tax=bioreactor metagenome TaxID=1076179 RepID=A0A644YI93_9ZZZZ
MKNLIITFIALITLIGCGQRSQIEIAQWVPFDESAMLDSSANHPSARMRFRLVQSQVRDKNIMLQAISAQLKGFSHEQYVQLTPFILDRSIPEVQSHIQSGELTYEKLVQWFLYRIALFENNRDSMLNAVIAVNPDAVKQAREKDRLRRKQSGSGHHPIYGMPVLVKDNINVAGMPTTAGTHLLRNHVAPDAAIIEQLKANGGIVLGKTNLSEWANYLFTGGPNGFSAVGGQTLNFYGRGIFDTGGSSSGSGVAMAANLAMAAIGTETSGSILSPSAKSSLVGLKPTVGLLSTQGIIPLSGTLDTPGPMTRTVVDNAILLSAMGGGDILPEVLQSCVQAGSGEANGNAGEANGNAGDANGNAGDVNGNAGDVNGNAGESHMKNPLAGLRFGVNHAFLADSLYRNAVAVIAELGGAVVEFDPVTVNFEGFGTLLSADMKIDLPRYLEQYASSGDVTARSIEDIIAYNREDSLLHIPYGQVIFESMAQVSLSEEEHNALKERLQSEGRRFFETPMSLYDLDVILSVDNFNASYAAAAHFPCLIVPMGFSPQGPPTGLTLIAKPLQEQLLLKIALSIPRIN